MARPLQIICVVLTLTGFFGTPSSAAGNSIVYTYDALGRLTSASYGTTLVLYTYDANGNRTQQAVTTVTINAVWGTPPSTFNWDQALWQ